MPQVTIDRELLERIPLDVLKTYGYAQTAHKIESILASPRQPEGDGWKLVPVEPTVGMLDIAVSHALAVSLSRDYSWSAYMRDVWVRMVEASLEPGK